MKSSGINADTKIGGKTLSQWDAEWAHTDGGVMLPSIKLYNHVGLYRLVLHGQVMGIGQAADGKRGGFIKIFQTLRGPPQKANSHSFAKLARQHLQALDIEIIDLGKGYKKVDLAKKLRVAMDSWYKLPWNEAGRKQKSEMAEQLKSGKRSKLT